MWQRFTERARRMVFFAQEEAAAHGQYQVGDDHLLAGLLREDDTVAGRLLKSLGVDIATTLDELRSLLEVGEGYEDRDQELNARGKLVIDNAYREAKSLGHKHIGTEHLLLGIAAVP